MKNEVKLPDNLEESIENVESVDNKEQEAEKEGQLKMLGRIQFLLVALLFIAAIFISDFVTNRYGNVWGTIALVVIAVITAIVLYRKEIKEFFTKGKK